jgi:hypothetical protein
MTEQATTAEDYGRTYRGQGCGDRMGRKPWSIYEIGAVVGGFAVFWPVGLLALFAKWKNGEIWKGASSMQAPWSNSSWGEWKKPEGFADFKRGAWQGRRGGGYTGNQAFDDYRKSALEKLEAERRKLEEERFAFDDFLQKLRRAKDEEAFNRFMAERDVPKAADSQ